MPKRLLIANWKMNLPPEGMDVYLQELSELDTSDIELVVAPPFPYLKKVHSMLASLGLRAAVAAQNCSEQDTGAFTGEVSASMLAEVGARYVIVGHSERRTLYGEDDETVGWKLRAVTAAGLVPVLCVGEDEETRRGGGTGRLLTRQLEAALRDFPRGGRAVVAYEPVWAIGTGQTATPEMAAEAHGLIRSRFSALGFSGDWSVLYGGSVTPESTPDLAAEAQIDGFLVGGSSLDASKFRAIYEGMLRAAAREEFSPGGGSGGVES